MGLLDPAKYKALNKDEIIEDVLMKNKKLQAKNKKLKRLWEETSKIIAYLKTDDETYEVGEDLEKLQKQALT